MHLKVKETKEEVMQPKGRQGMYPPICTMHWRL